MHRGWVLRLLTPVKTTLPISKVLEKEGGEELVGVSYSHFLCYVLSFYWRSYCYFGNFLKLLTSFFQILDLTYFGRSSNISMYFKINHTYKARHKNVCTVWRIMVKWTPAFPSSPSYIRIFWHLWGASGCLTVMNIFFSTSSLSMLS